MSSPAGTGSASLHDRLPAWMSSPWAWVIAALAAIVARDVGPDLARVLDGFSDTDDALRLVQVRHLLAGQGWFDLSIAEVGAPEHLVTHWSRLIDVPLAAIIAFAGLVVDQGTAEAVALYVWPTLLLGVLMAVVAHHQLREAGPAAALAALFLIIVSVPALFQFRTGRIDHHSLQILGTVAGALLLQRSLVRPALGPAAGACLGLALSVGLEPLPLVVAIIGLAALMAAVDLRLMPGVLRAVVAFAVVLVAGFVATQHPATWADVPCDAVGLNLIAFALAGAAATVGVGVLGGRIGLIARLGLLAAGGLIAIAAYVGVEPVCAGGPYAKSDPGIWPVWLSDVLETKSLFAFAEDMPALVVAFFLSSAIALVAAFRLFRAERSAATLFQLGVVVLAAFYGCIQLKLMPYAGWLVVPATATWVIRLEGSTQVPMRTLRLAALGLVSSATLALVAGLAVAAVSGKAVPSDPPAAQIEGCQRNADHRRLASLAPGLVLADLDLGPYIVVNSAHRVVAAPYHRIDTAIIAHARAMNGPVADGEAQLRALGVTYVVLCMPKQGVRGQDGVSSLVETLKSGSAVAYLEPVRVPGLETMAVWRVRPALRGSLN